MKTQAGGVVEWMRDGPVCGRCVDDDRDCCNHTTRESSGPVKREEKKDEEIKGRQISVEEKRERQRERERRRER